MPKFPQHPKKLAISDFLIFFWGGGGFGGCSAGFPVGMSKNTKSALGEKLKYHPFWGSPLFYKAPPRQFQPPKCKLTPPSKIQIGEGGFLCISIQKLQIGGRQSLFGGCQFTFWRVPICILEAEIVLRMLYRKDHAFS